MVFNINWQRVCSWAPRKVWNSKADKTIKLKCIVKCIADDAFAFDNNFALENADGALPFDNILA